jgi:hypothetical protein
MSNEISILARPNRSFVALNACAHQKLFRRYARDGRPACSRIAFRVDQPHQASGDRGSGPGARRSGAAQALLAYEQLGGDAFFLAC